MQRIFLSIALAFNLAIAESAIAQTPSSITLDARTVAAARGETQSARPKGASRETTSHQRDLEITVSTLRAAEEITLRWFWLGRYESSNNYFRSGDGEATVMLAPKKAQTVIVDDAKIESHYTETKKGSYRSGGRMAGWVVTARNSRDEIIAMKASDPALLRFATEPPPKQRK